MKKDESKKSGESAQGEDDGWESIDDSAGPAPVTKPVAVEEDERVYAEKTKAPPWMMGMYTALSGLFLAVLLLVLPEFRQFRLTGTTSLPTGYFLMIVPVIAILWALGGLVHKDYAADRGKAIAAIFIAVASWGILGYAVATDPANDAAADGLNEQQQRLDMTEQELQVWREKTLNR
jgi:hypothetical protein